MSDELEIRQMWNRQLSPGCLSQFLRYEEIINGAQEEEVETKAEALREVGEDASGV